MKVVITGTSSGFGKLLVADLLSKGCEVIATLRNLQERASLFEEETQKYGTRLRLVEVDVREPSDVEHLISVIGEEWGGQLDVLVNNAGCGLFGAFEDMDEDQLREQFEVNFFGLTRMTKALLPALRKSKGKIINLSSILGRVAFPLNSAYCASKFAVEGFSESLHHELRPHGVQVTIVEPGGFRTEFGKKVSWSNRFNDSASPYFWQTKMFRAALERRFAKPGANPAEVSRLLSVLVFKKKLPLRVAVGTDAKSLRALQAFVPDGLFHSILDRGFSKILNSKIKGDALV